MQLSEHELREMIRDAIARSRSAGDRSDDRRPAAELPHPALRPHPSHVLFDMVPSGDGNCIIEPAVRCNHCGYCKSYGH
jgi:hypothetical protein